MRRLFTKTQPVKKQILQNIGSFVRKNVLLILTKNNAGKLAIIPNVLIFYLKYKIVYRSKSQIAVHLLIYAT